MTAPAQPGIAALDVPLADLLATIRRIAESMPPLPPGQRAEQAHQYRDLDADSCCGVVDSACCPTVKPKPAGGTA
jgi:hypothetical protein